MLRIGTTSGSLDRGHLVEFGYYDQHLKTLPGDKTGMRAVWPHDDADANWHCSRQTYGHPRGVAITIT